MSEDFQNHQTGGENQNETDDIENTLRDADFASHDGSKPVGVSDGGDDTDQQTYEGGHFLKETPAIAIEKGQQ